MTVLRSFLLFAFDILVFVSLANLSVLQHLVASVESLRKMNTRLFFAFRLFFPSLLIDSPLLFSRARMILSHPVRHSFILVFFSLASACCWVSLPLVVIVLFFPASFFSSSSRLLDTLPKHKARKERHFVKIELVRENGETKREQKRNMMKGSYGDKLPAQSEMTNIQFKEKITA